MLNNVYKAVIQRLPLVYLYLKASFNTRNEIIDFEVLEANKIFADQVASHSDSLTGKTLRDIFPQLSTDDLQWMIQQAVNLEANQDFELARFCSVSNRWFKINIFCQQKYHLVFIYDDITLEQKLKESEHRLRQLAANIPGVVYQFHILPDGQFIISYMSDGGIEIFNRPLNQLCDYSKLFEDVCPEHKFLLEKSITQAAKTFSDWDHEFCITTPKGIKKWLRGMSKPRKDGKGGIFWDGVLLDISLQKKTEEKLRQSEKRFQSIVQSQQEMICRFLPDTTLTFVNQAYCNYFGKKEADLLGKKFLDYLPETNLRLMKEHLLLFTPQSPAHVFENQIAKDDSNSIWQEWNTYAIFNEEGQIVEFQAIGNDITDKKKNLQLEQELQIANKSARFKKNFLANMSHEMRTPLTGIIGMTEILSSTKLSNQQKEYVEVLKDSGENLMEIINQVLDFSKIEAGKVKLNFRPIFLKALLENTEKLFHAICSKNIEFEGQLDSELPACIEADQGRIEQIINNLISNAVKFTAKGKITLEIKNEKLLPDNELLLKITVCDTGIGLSVQKQKNIFEPFVQADDKDTRAYEGTGLGLSVSKNLASLHGGEIGLESAEGKGSCFWFTFKAKYCKNLDEQQHSQADVTTAARSLKILYAEDKQVNQKVVKLMLHSLGHEVTLVNNGLQALEAYAADSFDLILMDIQMPVMDGISAVKKLRETFKNPPPIVGLSANAFEGDQQKYLAQGMDAYLTKPVKRKDLEAMLKSFFPPS